MVDVSSLFIVLSEWGITEEMGGSLLGAKSMGLIYLGEIRG
jgi:hypothetical protein